MVLKVWNLSYFVDGTCAGVCVADHIAEYCEAYLITPGLCKSGTKCCVSRDIYPDKVPADLRIPNTQGQNNNSQPSKPTKSVSTQRPKQPTKQSVNRPHQRPQEPSRESLEGNHIGHQRPCDGECVSGLFALFCDELDNEAFCPNEGSCCVTSETSEGVKTTPRPHVTVSISVPILSKMNPRVIKLFRHKHQNALVSVWWTYYEHFAKRQLSYYKIQLVAKKVQSAVTILDKRQRSGQNHDRRIHHQQHDDRFNNFYQPPLKHQTIAKNVLAHVLSVCSALHVSVSPSFTTTVSQFILLKYPLFY